MAEQNRLARALLAKRQLEAQQSAQNREYRDRIRRLQGAADALVSSACEAPALLPVASSLPPDLIALINAPDRGL